MDERGVLRAWRRPTLPHLGVQYHWRGGFSRPSSGWDRVFGPSLWPPGRQCLPPEVGRTCGPCRPTDLVRGRPLSLPWLEGGGCSGGLSGDKRGVCEAPRSPFLPAARFCGDRFAGEEGLAAARGRYGCGGTRFRRGPSKLAPGSSAGRAISTGQLSGLRRFHLRPIDVVVFHGSRRDLVLRRVSRLDAFSGYPVRT